MQDRKRFFSENEPYFSHFLSHVFLLPGFFCAVSYVICDANFMLNAWLFCTHPKPYVFNETRFNRRRLRRKAFRSPGDEKRIISDRRYFTFSIQVQAKTAGFKRLSVCSHYSLHPAPRQGVGLFFLRFRIFPLKFLSCHATIEAKRISLS